MAKDNKNYVNSEIPSAASISIWHPTGNTLEVSARALHSNEWRLVPLPPSSNPTPTPFDEQHNHSPEKNGLSHPPPHSRWVTPTVFNITTCNAPSDKFFVKITAFLFQCGISYLEHASQSTAYTIQNQLCQSHSLQFLCKHSRHTERCCHHPGRTKPLCTQVACDIATLHLRHSNTNCPCRTGMLKRPAVVSSDEIYFHSPKLHDYSAV